MDELFHTLRAALAENATPEQRVAGVTACRAVLAQLEAQLGAQMPPTPHAPPTPAMPVSPLQEHIALIANALRSGMPIEGLLGVLVDRLAGAVRAREERWLEAMRAGYVPDWLPMAPALTPPPQMPPAGDGRRPVAYVAVPWAGPAPQPTRSAPAPSARNAQPWPPTPASRGARPAATMPPAARPVRAAAPIPVRATPSAPPAPKPAAPAAPRKS